MVYYTVKYDADLEAQAVYSCYIGLSVSDLHGELPGGLQDERSERRAPCLLALAATFCVTGIGGITGRCLAVQQLQDGQAKGQSLA